MRDHEISAPTVLERKPWNKGKPIGAKPPLRPKHVWSIRTDQAKLQVEGRTRDLAMFNLAIDSKLRGCDVVGMGRRSVIAPPVSAQNPWNGVSRVMREPMVRTMRQPPISVPSPIAA